MITQEYRPRVREMMRKAKSERPQSLAWILGGLVLTGAIVALGVWGYPELSRTLKMHRM